MKPIILPLESSNAFANNIQSYLIVFERFQHSSTRVTMQPKVPYLTALWAAATRLLLFCALQGCKNTDNTICETLVLFPPINITVSQKSTIHFQQGKQYATAWSMVAAEVSRSNSLILISAQFRSLAASFGQVRFAVPTQTFRGSLKVGWITLQVHITWEYEIRIYSLHPIFCYQRVQYKQAILYQPVYG